MNTRALRLAGVLIKMPTLSRPPCLLACCLVTWAMVLLSGCHTPSPQPPLSRFKFSEPHMGTLYDITLYAPEAAAANAAAEAAFRRIAELDRMMTDYNTNSELMRLTRHAVGEPVPVSPDLFAILVESEKVSRQTGGAFDITVGPFVQAWRTSRRTGKLPSPAQLAELRQAVGYQKLRLDQRARTVTLLAPHMRLDLGGNAKGYAADQALAVIRRAGFRSALVAASGDLAIGDAPPGMAGWKIGIAALEGLPNTPPRTILLHNAGVSTSGDTEQNVEINGVRYSHIVDPVTGLGLTNRIQVTVIGPNATITDGLDTPLDIMGVERALALVDSHRELAALIVTKDDSGTHTFPSRQFRRRFP